MHSGTLVTDHTDSSMSIPHPALVSTDCELCILAYWYCDHTDDFISILHPDLAIIVGELHMHSSMLVNCDHVDDSMSIIHLTLAT